MEDEDQIRIGRWHMRSGKNASEVALCVEWVDFLEDTCVCVREREREKAHKTKNEPSSTRVHGLDRARLGSIKYHRPS